MHVGGWQLLESVCMWEGGDCLRVCGHDMHGRVVTA